MLRIRVAGGTRSTLDSSLCDSCKHSTIIQGMRSDQRVVNCSIVSGRISFNVERCSDYAVFGSQSLYDMKMVATIIEKRPSGAIGFHSPNDWRRKRPDEEIIPGDTNY